MSTFNVQNNASGLFSDPQANAFSGLNSEEFIRIMFSELSRQDPMQPNDSKDLLQQLSSLRSIQSDMDLSNRLNALVSQNEMASASGLIGRKISGLSEQFERVEGIVSSVSRTPDGAVLKLRTGVRVPMQYMDQVLEVTP